MISHFLHEHVIIYLLNRYVSVRLKQSILLIVLWYGLYLKEIYLGRVRGWGYPGDLIIPLRAVNEPPHAASMKRDVKFVT